MTLGLRGVPMDGFWMVKAVDIDAARTALADHAELLPDQYSKAQCAKLHETVQHVSFLLARACGEPQSRRGDNREPSV